jgi:hypothetical protein
MTPSSRWLLEAYCSQLALRHCVIPIVRLTAKRKESCTAPTAHSRLRLTSSEDNCGQQLHNPRADVRVDQCRCAGPPAHLVKWRNGTADSLAYRSLGSHHQNRLESSRSVMPSIGRTYLGLLQSMQLSVSGGALNRHVTRAPFHSPVPFPTGLRALFLGMAGRSSAPASCFDVFGTLGS